MKSFLIPMSILLLPFANAFASNISTIRPFELKNATMRQLAEMKCLVQDAKFLKINKVTTNRLLQEKNFHLRLEIPFSENSTKVLNVQRVEIFSPKEEASSVCLIRLTVFSSQNKKQISRQTNKMLLLA